MKYLIKKYKKTDQNCQIILLSKIFHKSSTTSNKDDKPFWN